MFLDGHQRSDGRWQAYSGAIFDLTSNARRPDGWNSADAAGLPILPGLVRYEEIEAGAVNHAPDHPAGARDLRHGPGRQETGSDNYGLLPFSGIAIADPASAHSWRLGACMGNSGTRFNDSPTNTALVRPESHMVHTHALQRGLAAKSYRSIHHVAADRKYLVPRHPPD